MNRSTATQLFAICAAAFTAGSSRHLGESIVPNKIKIRGEGTTRKAPLTTSGVAKARRAAAKRNNIRKRN